MNDAAGIMSFTILVGQDAVPLECAYWCWGVIAYSYAHGAYDVLIRPTQGD